MTEPLVGFLAIGFGLFGLFALVSTDDLGSSEKEIIVDRDALLEFVQFRSRAFEPEFAAARLDEMPAPELQLLIEDYIREEALYREALALGMDTNDYIIKQRMIQKVEFINTGFVTASVNISDSEAEEFLAANKDNYYVDPFVTFTHVFFDSERRGRYAVRQLAEETLFELNSTRAPFSDASRHGDRFLYHTNYVERNLDYVASHFGETMTRRIFELAPDDEHWNGPFESPYGFHLVMLASKAEGRYPSLTEIEDLVREDVRRARINEESAAAIEAIIDTYDVRIEFQPHAINSTASRTASIRFD